ncbi:MAG TPA: hypothetical protein VE978_26945 [Chitinophagales bacterium]|nr:hypothetical protein [Chitinophagales bacterium]
MKKSKSTISFLMLLLGIILTASSCTTTRHYAPHHAHKQHLSNGMFL